MLFEAKTSSFRWKIEVEEELNKTVVWNSDEGYNNDLDKDFEDILEWEDWQSEDIDSEDEEAPEYHVLNLSQLKE